MESLSPPAAPITGVRLSRHRLPLARPLRLGRDVVHARELILVRATDSRGNTGVGEIAPLPHFSAESIEEAQVHAVRQARLTSSGAEGVAAEAPASVRFGFGMARAALEARQSGRRLHDHLGARDQFVRLGGLLTGSPAENLRAAEGMVKAGYEVLKLKVAVAGVEEEKQLILDLRETAGPAVELRLDANRGWSFEDAVEAAEAVLAADVAYVEEPLSDGSRLRELVEATGMPVALDEGMRGPAEAREAGLAVARAAIVKPMLTGFDESLAVGLALAQRGVRPVLSAAFESGVGMRGLLALAACVPFADSPAGCDTYGWVAHDVVRPRLSAWGSRIDLRSLLSADVELDLDEGEEVSL